MANTLDQELADAIGADDAHPAPTPAPKVAAPAPNKRRKNLGMLITLLAMVGALTTFFFFGLKPAQIYATPVDQLAGENRSFVGRKVRMEGELVPGTLEKRDQPCEYRFTVHGEKSQVAVRYPQCVIPDTFRDVPQGGVQVTVEGTLAAGGTFEATQVMAKCASKYDPKTHTMGPGPAEAQAL